MSGAEGKKYEKPPVYSCSQLDLFNGLFAF